MIVVCGMPAQTPTTITAGSAYLKSSEPVGVPGEPELAEDLVHGPERGWSISRHMIATITGGIAHGTRASVRASQRSLSRG